MPCATRGFSAQHIPRVALSMRLASELSQSVNAHLHAFTPEPIHPFVDPVCCGQCGSASSSTQPGMNRRHQPQSRATDLRRIGRRRARLTSRGWWCDTGRGLPPVLKDLTFCIRPQEKARPSISACHPCKKLPCFCPAGRYAVSRMCHMLALTPKAPAV